MNNNIRIKSIVVPDEVDEKKIIRTLEVICIDKLISVDELGSSSEDFYFLCFEKAAIEKKIYVIPVNGLNVLINKFAYESHEQWGRNSTTGRKERRENRTDFSSELSETVGKE